MFTPLPLVVIDGAEKVVPAAATCSACQCDEPSGAQKNFSEWFGPWTAMLTLLPLTVIDGPAAARAGAAAVAPKARMVTAAPASDTTRPARRALPRRRLADRPPTGARADG